MMNASPSSKRIKLDPSLSPPENDQNPENTSAVDDELEQEHCTICLQPFLDRTIIPVCAHEFCFECILLWSEQSRKCPLCSRSFEDSYLIHHIRSQYDYQKHYLPPLRSSPPPLTGDSRATALRNTRRERQWGRRQRREREEADQLERAVARRRWIYQHHLYAKHVASNPYTRYRPFPTPAQFATSPDLISRMTMFLRRELCVWPNLDVEFLTTYAISLMKSIDIRSESAVKLLSEFLDLDTPYVAGARHVNAEHFAHEIYSYLRSPYRDLTMYDQMAQYDTPPDIPPPREIERGSRWSADRSSSRRSRSRSNSRYPSPAPHHESNVMRSPATRHDRDSSAEVRREDRSNHRHGPNRSPRQPEDQNFRNHPGRRHSPPDGGQNPPRNSHPEVLYPEPSNLAVPADDQDTIPSHFLGDDKGKSQTTDVMQDIVAATDTPEMSALRGDDFAAALAANEAGATRIIDGPLERSGDEAADYVHSAHGNSSANTHPSRKRSAGLNVHLRPRNRTLSESVQSYLSRPAVPWHPPKKQSVSGDKQPTWTTDANTTTDTRPRLLLRLTDGPTNEPPSARKTTVEKTADSAPTPDDDVAFMQEQPTHERRFPSSLGFSSNNALFTGARHGSGGDCADDSRTRFGRADGADSRAVGSPTEPGVTPLTRETNALTLEGSLADGRSESPSGVDDAPDARSGAISSTFITGELAGYEDDLGTVGPGNKHLGDATVVSWPSLEPGSGSASTWGPEPDTSASDVDPDMSALEKRLRARARVRVRLAAMKGAVGTRG